MPITRVRETQVKHEITEALHESLKSIIPLSKSSEGCVSVTLYESSDDPLKFTIIRFWDSVESHQSSVRNIPPKYWRGSGPWRLPHQVAVISN